jgi:hypothetical protein
MRTLKLKPVTATGRIFAELEKRKLIRRLKATPKVLGAKSRKGAVSTIYSSSASNGTHKLICVRVNSPVLKLNFHPDNEEFIILKSTRARFKPLYIIIGLSKSAVLEAKAKRGKLNSDDFVALRLKYNDPSMSVFTMLKGTVHCEATSADKGIGPVFFVTEPSKLKMDRLRLQRCRLQIWR